MNASSTVLILGANSGIARALCHRLAARKYRLILAARRTEELETQAADLRIRHGIEVTCQPFDALDFDGHAAFFERCVQMSAGGLEGVVLAYGSMLPQATTQTDLAAARQVLDANFTSPVALLSLAANHMEPRHRGWIAAISSVAGDRGRQSNYTYGAAKAGFSCWLQGLRNRLFHHGVHVLTIKPGFVDTPMTHGLLNPKSPLVATPDKVARDIDRAIHRRRNILYTPWFWRGILTIIATIPEALFKRLKM